MRFAQHAEDSKGLQQSLSAVLGVKAGNKLTEAMSLYGEGIFAEYCKIMEDLIQHG